MTDWQQAACLGGETSYWYDRPKGNSRAMLLGNREAEAICSTCPIRVECYRYAVSNQERHGLWGGVWMDRDVLERDGLTWWRERCAS